MGFGVRKIANHYFSLLWHSFLQESTKKIITRTQFPQNAERVRERAFLHVITYKSLHTSCVAKVRLIIEPLIRILRNSEHTLSYIFQFSELKYLI